jgi:hypothetical protein
MAKRAHLPPVLCVAALILFLLSFTLASNLYDQQMRRALRPASPEACARFAQERGCAFPGEEALGAFGEGEIESFWLTNFSPQMRASDVQTIGYGVQIAPVGDGPCEAITLYAYPAGAAPESLSGRDAIFSAEPLDVDGLAVSCRESARPFASLAPPLNAVLVFSAPTEPWAYTVRVTLSGPYTEEVQREVRESAAHLLRALLSEE